MESKNNKIQNLFGKKNGVKVYNMINDLEMEQWKKIEVELENIPLVGDKISYLEKCHFEYKLNATGQTLAASAIVFNEFNMPAEYFLDRKISEKILYLKKSTIAKEEISLEFANEFDHVEPKKVYKHFKEGLVDAKYMSLEDLSTYLKLAFEKKKEPNVKFQFANLERGKIIQVFYEYYSLASKPHGKALIYAKLLGEYFDGFSTKNIKSNFAKRNPTKKRTN